MTFKHVKFGDSVTMRSLERVAQEKGWIKNDPIKKTAAGPDLNPSINFMENIVKLCSGLRHAGFDKYADELEGAFVAYKQADKVYDVSNEKGEDLVDAAHPEGGHQMEGVEGDAFVETILEKHLKMLDVSNKEPKANKLSNAQDILKAVRMSLAQAPSVQGLINDANKDVNIVFQIATKSGGLTAPVLSWLEGRKNTINQLIGQSEEDLSIDTLNESLNTINDISRNLHPNALHNYLPEFLNKGISTDILWSKVSERLQSAKSKLQEAAGLLAEHQMNPESAPAKPSKVTTMPEVQVASNPIISGARNLINKLNAFKSVGPIAANRDAANWIAAEIKELQDLMRRVSAVPEGQESTVAPYLEKELAEKTNEVNEFAASWTK